MEEFEEGAVQNGSDLAMNLLSRIGCYVKKNPGKFEVKEEKDFEVELTLGLSLNGKFGVDPSCDLIKGSFVASEWMKPGKIEEEAAESVCGYFPVGTTMEVVRNRKEVQSLRRMEAKRRRMEKMRSFRPAKDLNENQECMKVLLPRAKSGDYGRICKLMPEAMKKCTKKRSPSKTPTSLQEQSYMESETNKPATSNENQMPCVTTAKGEGPDTPMSLPELHSDLESEPNISVTSISNENRSHVVSKEIARKMLLKMTCVMTRGEGTDGNEMRGLLYPCKKGEELRIVCVCHGSFLSPTEFVKHAGGGDVENPLKHIVVSSSSFT